MGHTRSSVSASYFYCKVAAVDNPDIFQVTDFWIMIVLKFSDYDWIENFRMKKKTFYHVVSMVSEEMRPGTRFQNLRKLERITKGGFWFFFANC